MVLLFCGVSHVTNQEALLKLAVRPSELVWVWATQWGNDGKGPHMFKSWFDREDTWGSVLTNLHNQVCCSCRVMARAVQGSSWPFSCFVESWV